MNLPLILNLLVFVALLLGLAQTHRTNWSLAKKVLLPLVPGVVFGVVLHAIYGAGNPVLKASIGWFDLVGNGYVQLLQMIVIPLVFASILSAVARLHNAASLGKISFLTIGTLLFTTANRGADRYRPDQPVRPHRRRPGGRHPGNGAPANHPERLRRQGRRPEYPATAAVVHPAEPVRRPGPGQADVDYQRGDLCCVPRGCSAATAQR